MSGWRDHLHWYLAGLVLVLYVAQPMVVPLPFRLSMMIPASLIAMILATGLLLRFRRQKSRGGAFLPASASGPPRAGRVAEAFMVLAIGQVVWAMLAFALSYRSALHRLDSVPVEITKSVVVAAVFASLCIVGCAVLSFRGRTVGAIVAGALVLISYAIFVQAWAGPRIKTALTSARRDRQHNDKTFVIDAYDQCKQDIVIGADFWINGVYIGKTPWRGTAGELLDGIPDWAEVPEGQPIADYRSIRDKTLPNYDEGECGWGDISVYDQRLGRDGKFREAFVRLRFGREWGYYGFGGGGGSSGIRFCVRLPARRRRMDCLFHHARLADYDVSDEWLAALRTYGDQIWWHLMELSEAEPGWRKVLDCWTIRDYAMGGVTDKVSAGRVFGQICDEADKLQYYHSGGVAGRAVEMLAPYLDAEELTGQATDCLSRTGAINVRYGTHNGRFYFGFIGPESLHRYAGYLNTATSWGWGGSGVIPVRMFPVAHAVKLLDQRLDRPGSPEPNIIEERVVPELVRAAYPGWTPILLRIAIHLGGPELETFLLRQDWKSMPDELGFNFNLGGADLNRWLYWLSQLQEPGADAFRRQHAKLLLVMADELAAEAIHSREDLDRLSFLFCDLDRGNNSMAMQYWPSFLNRYKGRVDDLQIESNLVYLVRAEPLSTPAMYIEAFRGVCLRDARHQNWYDILADLPQAKQREVFEALIAAFKTGRLFPPCQEQDTSIQSYRNDVLQQLEMRMKWGADPDSLSVAHWLERLSEPEGDRFHDSFRGWFDQKARPDHPVIDALAGAASPSLRGLSLHAIRKCPTPQARQLLAGLCDDSDETVRKLAREVDQELRGIASTPPSKFVAFPEDEMAMPAEAVLPR